MADLSNEELKVLLEKRIAELENSDTKEEKAINPESVQALIKTLALPNDFVPLAQRVLELAPRINVVWLHLAECTGCSESLFRTTSPDLVELLFDFISLEYHETLMAAAGWQAEHSIDELLASKKNFILAVEGGVAPIDTYFLTIGANGESGYEILQKLANKAKAIFAMGTCSSYGGVQAATPNPSKVCGIAEVLRQKIVQVPGCPPSDINIVANLSFYMLFQTLPNLDERNRPKWAYGKCLHDMCERKAKFEAGVFAQKFDDELAKSGACLFKVGCKGPYTYNNCPKVKFNAKTSWPVQGGHGCMACSEANFWDEFGFYEEPMKNLTSYIDFSFANSDKKGFASLDKAQIQSVLDDKRVILSFDNETRLLYKGLDDEPCDFLKFEFESNVKLVLANIAKNKLGASLLETYKKEFAQNYAFIEANYDDTPRPSSNIFKFFEYTHVLARGEFLPDMKTFLDLAASYKFKHISPLDIKLSLNDTEAKLDVSKSFRMPLIYLSGGLEIEALAFSACELMFKNLNQALKHLSQKQNKAIAFNFPQSYDHAFFQSQLARLN
ncbi:hydrogenase small subunit [Campylobacter sp. MIT 97-5078]|uniref:hydrogenase small subunit n=1 Tax=Campylobacter sp. MIT 97-5078 TaxID=1548153 RepID=UPI0009DCD9AB|nr:hydrogenase small subunit [Campylobacter sp. MIT 97-5078]TQR26986.1 oxidoreductase [Campylobacter sp. MIT 97-5078]